MEAGEYILDALVQERGAVYMAGTIQWALAEDGPVLLYVICGRGSPTPVTPYSTAKQHGLDT